jgi:hypothetical protein
MATNGTITPQGGQAIADETILYGDDANMRAEGVSVRNVQGGLEIIDRKAQAQNQERLRKLQQGVQTKPTRSQLYQFYEANKFSRPKTSAPSERRGVRNLGGGNFLTPTQSGAVTSQPAFNPNVIGVGPSGSHYSSNQPYPPVTRQDEDNDDFFGDDVQMEGESNQQ